MNSTAEVNKQQGVLARILRIRDLSRIIGEGDEVADRCLIGRSRKINNLMNGGNGNSERNADARMVLTITCVMTVSIRIKLSSLVPP